MKLLPPAKPKRKVICGDKNKYRFLETDKSKRDLSFRAFVENNSKEKGKKLSYNLYAKKLISENPGLLKAFDYLVKNKSEKRFVSDKEKFEILRVTNIVKNNKREIACGFTNEAFVLTLNKYKPPKRFFIKYSLDYRGKLSLTQELISLKYIEKIAKEHGFEIIKPHFAFDNFNKKGSFIAYDFSYLKTLRETSVGTTINTEYNKIINKIIDLKIDLCKNLGINSTDITEKNIFIDMSIKPYKLYLFDTYFEKESSDKLKTFAESTFKH